MGEFKGTRGKWGYEYDNSDYSPHEWYNITSENHGNILKRSYYNTDLTCEQMKANALLISKAPEMLDFINRISGEMLRNDFVLEEKWYEQAQQLIKEATEI